MLKHCLKCGHANPQATGAELDACPECGAIYSRVEAAVAAKAAERRSGVMHRNCLKCGHANPQATGAELEACPECGAIYSRVEAAMAAKAAAARVQQAAPSAAAAAPALGAAPAATNTAQQPAAAKTGQGLLSLALIAGVLMWLGSGDSSTSSKPSETLAFIQCQDFVKERLRAPATADFPSLDRTSWDMSDNTWVVKSYVDSQNGFGAMLRSNWHCKVQYVGNDPLSRSSWKLLALEIG